MDRSDRMTPEDHLAQTIATIRSVPMFTDLTPPVLALLARIARVEFSPAQTQLCQQGALPEVLHILLDGQVALTGTAPDGTTTVVEVLHPPGYFVLAAVLTELPYLMSARTVIPSRLLHLNAAGLRALVREEPPIAHAMLMSQARDFRRMVGQVRDLKLRTAAQRLGCYLLALVEDPMATRAEVKLPFDKGLLAGRLGCRPENLSRSFATLRAFGVETRGARVALRDINRLRMFSAPDENLAFGLPALASKT